MIVSRAGMHGKKAQGTLVWGETIKLIVTISFFVIAIYIGAKIAQGYFAMGASPVKKDWTVIARELGTLEPKTVIGVPAGVLQVSRLKECGNTDAVDCYAGLIIESYPPRDAQAPPECKLSACVCGRNAVTQKIIGCELLENSCGDGKNCDEKLCVSERGKELVNRPDYRVELCKKCTGALSVKTAPRLSRLPVECA